MLISSFPGCRYLPLIILVCLLAIVAVSGCVLISCKKRTAEKTGEFRGVWVATVLNIDFKTHKSAADFRRDAIEMLDKIKSAGLNAVIFQVRPMNDAFYFSEYNPWSRWLTGSEGAGLDESGFSPLAFLIDESHNRNLEFHAWLNPFRVANNVKGGKDSYLKTLDRKNFAFKHPELVLEFPGDIEERSSLILNPGEPEVRKFLLNTVEEIIRNHDVDAIHFDDYFYPYVEIGDLDIATFKRESHRGQNLGDWRRENINLIIKEIRKLIGKVNKQEKRNIEFGISPLGIWANNAGKVSHPAGSATKGSQSYYLLYADTRKWVQENWIDYIVPQVYSHRAHPKAPYKTLVEWWDRQAGGTDVKLYIGQAFYRVTHPDWPEDEIIEQLRFNRTCPSVSGTVFFSYRHIVEQTEPQKEKTWKEVKNFWNETPAEH